MADDDASAATPPPQQANNFTAPQQSAQSRLSTHTVGLVALSDFRKRRAEALEHQEREARERVVTQQRQLLRQQQGKSTAPAGGDQSGTQVGTGDEGSGTDATGTEREGASGPGARRKKAKVGGGKKAGRIGGPTKLSFAHDDDEDEAPTATKKAKDKNGDANDARPANTTTGEPIRKPGGKLAANSAIAVLPRAVTKAALARDAAERDALRRRFLAVQERVRSAEIAVPFVFYDGSSTPGGTVRMKKGDFVWVFLDRSRKMGAKNAGAGASASAAGGAAGSGSAADTKAGLSRKEWARVGVDDLLLVRGSVIIPHVSSAFFVVLSVL